MVNKMSYYNLLLNTNKLYKIELLLMLMMHIKIKKIIIKIIQSLVIKVILVWHINLHRVLISQMMMKNTKIK